MPILKCYVDDTTLAVLLEYAQRHGRTVDDLAEAAISDAAVMSVHPNHRPEIFGKAPRPAVRQQLFDSRTNKVVGEIVIPADVLESAAKAERWMAANACDQVGGIKIASAMRRDSLDV